MASGMRFNMALSLWRTKREGKTAMSSEESSNTRYPPSRNEDYGQGQRSHTHTEQYTQEGMTTHPSVGRFNEKEPANPMYVRKPSVGSNPTKAFDGQPMATQSNHGMLPHDSSSQSSSGGIVGLRSSGPPRAEGRNKGTQKGKK